MDGYYSGPLRQRGRGLGNIFGIFSRYALPFLKKAAVPFIKKQVKRIGPHAVKAGVGALSDIASRKRTVKQAVRSRGRQFIADTINTKPPPKKRQLRGRPRKRNTKRRKTDIFS